MSQNLLPNSSFENFQNCPTTTTSGINSPDIDDWLVPVNHIGTPDVFNPCDPGSFVSVPINLLGTQPALGGDGYVGLYAYRNGVTVREYLGAQLSAPMQAGFTYRVVCNYSLADETEMAVDGFGVHFSNGQLSSGVGSQDVLGIVPSYLHTSLMTERIGWATITFDYIAQGGEDYFTMGFFLDDNTMNIVSQGPFPRNESYYYFDEISVEELPVLIDAGPDQSICHNESVQLSVSGNAPFWWSVLGNPITSIGTGSNIIVAPQISTTYVVHGNLSTDTVEVVVSSLLEVNLGSDTLLCPGSSLVLQNNVHSSQSLWQDGSTNNNFSVSETGNYRLTATAGACTSIDNIFVEIASYLEIAPDTTVCFGDQYRFDAYPFNSTTGIIETSYLWMDGQSRQERSFDNSQFISVETTSVCGLRNFSVNLEYEDCDCYLYIPSAFTPDSDGLNDIFKPKHDCDFAAYRMDIFDRWGNQVFTTKAPDLGWDGGNTEYYTAGGLYNYYVTYRLKDSIDDRLIKGSMTVVR